MPSGECEPEGGGDTALYPPIWGAGCYQLLQRGGGEETIYDADFTGFTTLATMMFLGVAYSFHSLNAGWFTQENAMKLRPPTVLASDSVTVLQQEDAFNGRTWKDAPGGATPCFRATGFNVFGHM